jgi:hypothetical protein
MVNNGIQYDYSVSVAKGIGILLMVLCIKPIR